MQIDHHEGLSPAEFAMQVIERLNARYGIRLDSVLTNPALSLSQRRVRREFDAAVSELVVELST